MNDEVVDCSDGGRFQWLLIKGSPTTHKIKGLSVSCGIGRNIYLKFWNIQGKCYKYVWRHKSDTVDVYIKNGRSLYFLKREADELHVLEKLIILK